MKHFWVLITIIFTAVTAWATAEMRAPENLLDIALRDQKQSDIYTGSPFIHIDETVGTQKEDQNTFEPMEFDKISDYIIQTPFGQKTEAAFVAHTTDFAVIVQILGNGDIMVNETVQFINTKGKATFERLISNIPNGEILVTSLKRNHAPVNKQIAQTPETIRIYDPDDLPSGIYTYELDYIVKNAILSYGKTNKLKFSLTGTAWPLPVERFSAVVLFPQKTTLYQNEVVFGSNELAIKDTVEIQTDARGDVYYTLKRPLPAFADVKIVLEFDKNALAASSLWDQMAEAFNHLLFVICLAALGLYTGITILYLKHKKVLKYPLKDLIYYSFISLRYQIKGTVEKSYLRQLHSYNMYIKKKDKIVCYFMTRDSRLLKPYIYWNVMRKYILTDGLLIALTIFQAANTGFALNIFEICILIIAAGLLNVWLYKYGEHPYIIKQMRVLTDAVVDTDMAFGLSKVSMAALFLRFYPYVLTQGNETKWIDYFKNCRLDFSPFTFIKEQDK